MYFSIHHPPLTPPLTPCRPVGFFAQSPLVNFLVSLINFPQENTLNYRQVTNLMSSSALPPSTSYIPMNFATLKASISLFHLYSAVHLLTSIHSTTISQDKAAVLAYLRLKHKDPYKGYILCAIVRNSKFRPIS